MITNILFGVCITLLILACLRLEMIIRKLKCDPVINTPIWNHNKEDEGVFPDEWKASKDFMTEEEIDAAAYDREQGLL